MAVNFTVTNHADPWQEGGSIVIGGPAWLVRALLYGMKTCRPVLSGHRSFRLNRVEAEPELYFAIAREP